MNRRSSHTQTKGQNQQRSRSPSQQGAEEQELSMSDSFNHQLSPMEALLAPNPSSSSQHIDFVYMNAQRGSQGYLVEGSSSSSRQEPAQAVVGPPTATRAELMNHPDQRGGVPSAWSLASHLHAASMPLVAGDEAWARDLQQWSESCTRLKAMVDEMES